MNTKYIKYTLVALLMGFGMTITTSCSDDHMAQVNTDPTKTLTSDPNAQLTTCLLQTYGDFGLMDTYRSYITGFTQHFAGGWNVSNYAGSVNPIDKEMRHIWDRYYTVAIKNLRDAIAHSADKPNVNAILRIHRVYLMAVLTDTYGDLPCMSINMGMEEENNMPKYDKQEDIYNWFFTELKACIAQLGTGTDPVTGDVTNYVGDIDLWKKYANSLRMRYAMRISDVANGDPSNPDALDAQKEFEAAYKDAAGYISSASEDAYIKYADSPYTLYAGSQVNDFRVNALGEMLYGQDPQSPTFICSTFFNYLNDNQDPRTYKICRHYINLKRSEIKPDKLGNVDCTQDVIDYLTVEGKKERPCHPGFAWYSTNDDLGEEYKWLNPPSNDQIPTLDKLVKQNPSAGYDKNNYPVRMMRPALSIDFEMPDRPGVLMTYAEVEFLLAEAKSKGWDVAGNVIDHFKIGTREAIVHVNHFYLSSENAIIDSDITTYVNTMAGKYNFDDKEQAREAINLQAWILHMMNPAEGWANLRRSDYPVLEDREALGPVKDFPRSDNLKTPVRLMYPLIEKEYNSVSYQEALDRMGGDNNWHKPLWWDKYDLHVKSPL